MIFWLRVAWVYVVKAVALVFWCTLILLATPFKLLLPWFRPTISRWIINFASGWVASNVRIYNAFIGAKHWKVSLPDNLDPQKSYLLLPNHQSWADILMLFVVFHRKIPFLRFFLKDTLIFVPLIGAVCWAMDFPFMKRYSPETLAKKPHLKGKDLETTKKACEQFQKVPVSVVNFVEGTRCTPEKRASKQSPYQHLLRPKAAGLSFMLNAMGEQFAGILAVDIAYQPTQHHVVWSFLGGEQRHASLVARTIDFPPELLHGSYSDDEAFRTAFQDWLNQHWAAKDQRLAQHLDQRLGSNFNAS
jgi:1-acyl-sn-glycerol-3-phosphate acyltransferase